MKRIVLLSLLSLWIISGCSKAPPRIHVERAIVNVIPNGAGAAYFDIVNDGDGADRLERVHSPVASASLHEVVREGDFASMRALESGIEVPKRSTVRLERGGRHVMLFGIANVHATEVPLELHFARAGDVRVSATVQPLLGTTPRRQLRVCADPNNLPFSSERGDGFENLLVSLIAKDLDADVAYTWQPQRRGFLRTTLKAKRCDVVVGVPKALDMVRTTRPYYRSTYVFVTKPGTPPPHSLDDPALHEMRIGVPLVGDDGANPPVALALASRGLVSNMRGYSVFGDYREESPPADLIRGLRRGEVDIALAWGPLAGWYAAHAEPKLTLAPIPQADAPSGMSFAFDIALGVRKDDAALANELDGVLERRKAEIASLLDRFGVPRVAM